MHRRGTGPRFMAGALALWFGLVTAAPAVLHGCPRALVEAAAGAAEAPAHHHHGAPAGQDTRLPQECTCLGTCATAGLATLPTPLELPAPLLLPSADGAIASAAAIPPATTPAHTRPFATAPPLRSA